MIKGFTVTTMLLAAAIEPALGEVDLFKYAITQGGLLAIVLVLLWAFRSEFRRKLEEERERTKEERERTIDADRRNDVLMSLIAQCNANMQKSASAAESQKDASHRLARAIEKLEDRR